MKIYYIERKQVMPRRTSPHGKEKREKRGGGWRTKSRLQSCIHSCTHTDTHTLVSCYGSRLALPKQFGRQSNPQIIPSGTAEAVWPTKLNKSSLVALPMQFGRQSKSQIIPSGTAEAVWPTKQITNHPEWRCRSSLADQAKCKSSQIIRLERLQRPLARRSGVGLSG